MSFEDFKYEVSKLLQFLEHFENVLLCGDFNARNSCWGDHVVSRKGKELEIATAEANLVCVNNGNFTFKRNRDSRGSVLDLTFTSAGLNVQWNVLEGHWGGSCHLPISLVIEGHGARQGRFLHKKKLISSLNKLDLEPDFAAIEDLISDEIKAATSKLDNNRTPKYWWNDQLATQYRLQLAAMKKARKYPCYENLIKAREEVEKWKDMVSKAKSDSFLAKIDDVNKESNSRAAWRFINNVRNRASAVSSNWNDENNGDYLELLKDQVPGNMVSRQASFEPCNNVDPVVLDYDHFEDILFKKKKGSAAGHDGITYEMLKALPGLSKRALLTAMTNALMENAIRDSWRVIKIVPIPKPNKDLDLIENYRPISLISVFIKCINLMLKDFILEHLENGEFCQCVPLHIEVECPLPHV
ncbi:uncharacterized protein [Musca autumnalis]|uniref:uncharacterized protein n=1 Tax=Musca autumnalis TaxID=221902 RepID=UPI003CF5452F